MINSSLDLSTNGVNNTNKESLSKVVDTTEEFTSIKNLISINADPYADEIILPAGVNSESDNLRIDNFNQTSGTTEGFPDSIEEPLSLENSGQNSVTPIFNVAKIINTKVVTESIDTIEGSFRVTGLYEVNGESYTGTGEATSRFEAATAAKADAENKYKWGI